MRPAVDVKAVPAEESKAIERAQRAPLPFTPTNLEEAWRTADMLSKASILPDTLKGKPHDLLVVLMTGAELGLSPMQSVREIYVVKGKGFISTLMKQALVRQSPHCEYLNLVESDEKRCVYETKRRGDPKPVRMSFTIEQARQAGLLNNDNWSKWPATMLRKRCASQLLDEVFPDVTRGIYTSDDEMETMHPTETLRRLDEPTGVRAPPPPPKAEEEPKPITAETELPASDVDVVDAVLSLFSKATTEKELDAIVKDAKAKVPAEHPRRAEVGQALLARKRELRGGP